MVAVRRISGPAETTALHITPTVQLYQRLARANTCTFYNNRDSDEFARFAKVNAATTPSFSW